MSYCSYTESPLQTKQNLLIRLRRAADKMTTLLVGLKGCRKITQNWNVLVFNPRHVMPFITSYPLPNMTLTHHVI